MKRTAIITGVTGQDGSYLADLLLEKDYRVVGVRRRSSGNGLGCCDHLQGVPGFEVVEGDVTDLSSLEKICRSARADEFYNLAAQSHVATSFSQPHYTMEATAHGALNCLEAIRESGLHTRFYQASSSEMFGGLDVPADGYDEMSRFYPRSPYGVAKLYAHWITVNYRESYKMFACCGVLFNHESPRRGPNFVTRKITRGIADIVAGRAKSISLGNLDAKRDWGHAKDYVRGMWLMLQEGYPQDFVLATGQTWSVRDFCKFAFAFAGLGEYQQYVLVDPMLYRPAEVHVLRGNASKAYEDLGWCPSMSFEDLVSDMVSADCGPAKVAA